MGEFSVNNTNLLYGLEGTDLDIFDERFNKVDEIEDYSNIQREYSFVPQFSEFTVRNPNKIISFSQNYNSELEVYDEEEISVYQIQKRDIEDSTALIASLAAVGGVIIIILIYCLCLNRKSVMESCSCCSCECCEEHKIEN